MNLNESKRQKLPIKTKENKEQTFTLNSKCLLHKGEQKDLGKIMTPKLSWKLSAHKKVQKRIVSFIAGKMTKLNAYVGYVIPAISYVSPMWLANKTQTKSIERIQRKAISRKLSNSSES